MRVLFFFLVGGFPGHRNLKGRAGHTATLVGTRIFVVGGRNGNVFFNDVWVFDTKTENWQQVQKETPLSPRAYHTTTLVRDSELWVIGGSDHNTMYGDVHMLNTNTLEVDDSFLCVLGLNPKPPHTITTSKRVKRHTMGLEHGNRILHSRQSLLQVVCYNIFCE
jgi:tRNA wybutosine-synthesizing protein 3